MSALLTSHIAVLIELEDHIGVLVDVVFTRLIILRSVQWQPFHFRLGTCTRTPSWIL